MRRSKKFLKSMQKVSEGFSAIQVQSSNSESNDFFVDSGECNSKMDQAFASSFFFSTKA